MDIFNTLNSAFLSTILPSSLRYLSQGIYNGAGAVFIDDMDLCRHTGY